MGSNQAVIYVRVSDPHQVEGTSLEFQVEECRKYCERNAMGVAAVFREEGESAKDLSLRNREEFLRALEWCRKHKGRIRHFVVLRVDRFARSTEDHFAVRKLLSDCGVALHSVTETIGNSPTEKFIETVLAGAAEYDNAIRKRRCTDGMATKISQGIFPWKPPVGYASSHAKRRGEKKTEPDQPDEQVFPLIQRALKEYAAGTSTPGQLVRNLDDWGLAKIRGTKTTPQFVDRLLGKYLKFYAGILVNPWSKEEWRGLHRPMVTEEEYHQIRFRRTGKIARAGKRHERFNPLFPLKQTVRCSACRRWLTGSVSRGHGGAYEYYHCATRGCQWYGKSISKASLEAAFLALLEHITPNAAYMAAFKETVLDYWREQGTQSREDSAKLRRRIAELQARRTRIFEMREDGLYTPEDFQERKAEVDGEIAAATASLHGTPGEVFDVGAALDYAMRFISALPKQWMACPPQLQERFQQVMFPEGIPFDRARGFGTFKFGFIYQQYVLYLERNSSEVLLKGFGWNLLLKELELISKIYEDSTPSLYHGFDDFSRFPDGS